MTLWLHFEPHWELQYQRQKQGLDPVLLGARGKPLLQPPQSPQRPCLVPDIAKAQVKVKNPKPVPPGAQAKGASPKPVLPGAWAKSRLKKKAARPGDDAIDNEINGPTRSGPNGPDGPSGRLPPGGLGKLKD